MQQIIDRILADGGHARPTGRSLYTYRVSSGLLYKLRDALQSLLNTREPGTGVEQAAFCLFAAEWFRRNHPGGVWSWCPVFQGLNLSPYQRSRLSNRIGRIVPDGLRWWGIPSASLIRTSCSNRYLTTIACQGGLPLQALTEHPTSFSRYLQAVLTDLEQFAGEPRLYAQDRAEMLPRTWQNETVFILIGDLVRAVADVRRELGEEVPSIELLDRRLPDWESRFPLQLDRDNETVLSLLDSVLETPRPRRETEWPRLVLETSVHEFSGHVQRTFVLPRNYPAEWLARECGLPPEQLPGRFQLALQSPDSESAGTTLSVQQGLVRLQGREPVLHATAQVQLLLRRGEQVLASVCLPGGEALPDTPWVFDPDTRQLIGSGSLSTSCPVVLVACAADWALLPEADAVAEPVSPIAGRPTWKISGTVRVSPASGEADGATVRIQTGASGERERFFSLVHTGTLRLGTHGDEVWRTIPTVREWWREEGRIQSRNVPDHELEYRVTGRGGWRPRIGPGNVPGEILLRVRRESAIMFQQRLIVLGRPLQCRVVPHAQAGSGEIRLTGLAATTVELARSDYYQGEVESGETAGEFTVQISSAHRQLPRRVTLRVTLNSGAVVSLQVACPVPSCRITDVAGEVELDSIALDDLDGLTLQLITARGGRYTLGDQADQFRWTIPAVPGQAGHYRLPLSLVRPAAAEVLAGQETADDPENQLRLVVRRESVQRPVFEFSVREHLGRLQVTHDPEGWLLEVPENLRRHHSGSCWQLTVSRFGYPGETLPQAVETLAPGVWRVTRNELPWLLSLAVASLNGERPLRPERLINLEAAPTTPALDTDDSLFFSDSHPGRVSYDHAMELDALPLRDAAWNRFLADYTAEDQHPDAEKLGRVVAELNTLPPTTFEVIGHLAQHPRLLCRFALENTTLAFWRRLERLPFLWQLIPLADWYQELDRLRLQLRERQADPLFWTWLEDLRGSLGGLFANLLAACDLIAFHHRKTADIFQRVARWDIQREPRLIAEYGTAYQALLQRNSDLHWPQLRGRWPDELWPAISQYRHECSGAPWRNDILEVPVMLAAASVHGFYPLERRLLCQVRLMKQFDTEWFDDAYRISLDRMIGERLRENPQFYLPAEA